MAMDHTCVSFAHTSLRPGSLSDHAPRVVAIAPAPLPISACPAASSDPSTTGAVVRPQPKGRGVVRRRPPVFWPVFADEA
jgi:hypothetical protein